MKSIYLPQGLLRPALILLFLNTCFLVSVKAQMPFSVNEITGLFSKDQPEVFDFIQSKEYEYKGAEAGFKRFSKHTLLGDYKLDLTFKNSKLDAIGMNQLVARGYLFIQDLNANNYAFSDNNVYSEDRGLFVGCIYRFDNLESGMMCTILRSSENENALWITFGKIPKKTVKIQSTKKKIVLQKSVAVFFTGTKKFHDEGDNWVYKVTIYGNRIKLESYPGKNNDLHPNKLKVDDTYTGIIKNGKIIIDRHKSEFKFENGVLYEIDNEGMWDGYTEIN